MTTPSITEKNDKNIKGDGSGKPLPEGANAIATQLGNLEEDDEFEDFPTQEWKEEANEESAERWDDNWDDDDVEIDFSVQLREEHNKSSME
ncbi:26S proteasome complex subunit SEM1 [Entomophthora muscae]|uniref:26S proteasome complex subunit SEM1 n=1 Tax=Entomophthora muscae TaxID=34485 RepID=A0ACC2TPU8_9FUNG|nr:26S proteasome complex subunit SEM1 [Entomophthora muscae]